MKSASPHPKALIHATGSLRLSPRFKCRLQGLIDRRDRHLALEVGDDRQRRKKVRSVADVDPLLVAIQLIALASIINRAVPQPAESVSASASAPIAHQGTHVTCNARWTEPAQSWLPGRSKAEPRATHELIACYRRAPVPLDVRDHLLVAPEMPTWISMIRVRQISTKHWPLPPVHQLSDAVRTTKHTPVEVYAHDNDILDRALLEERQQLPAVIRNGVGR